MKRLYLSGMILIIGLFSTTAQVPQYISDSLQQILDIYQGGSTIPGISAAVNIYDVGIWTGTSGESFENELLSPDMLLGIGSNTKLFTATMMMKLAELEIVSLDDSLHHWLPSFDNIDSNVTIKQLLRHNTGIADFWTPTWVSIVFANPDSVWKPEDVLNYVGPPLFPAGTSVAYSNTNFTLAGMIIEAATGFEYPTIIRDSIINPLNLNNTFLEGFETITEVSAHPWHLGEDVYLVPRTAITTSAYAAGCIKSTTQDMVTWYDHLFNQNFLTEGGFTELTDFIDVSGSVNGVGCGIFRMNYNSKTYYLHSGNIRGYASYTLYDVEDKHSISVLRNDTFINCENVAKALAKAINVLITTEISESSNESAVEIFPVPAGDYINIQLIDISPNNYHVEIFDLSGKLISQQIISSSGDMNIIKINTSNLIQGIYILKLYSNENSITRKFIKK